MKPTYLNRARKGAKLLDKVAPGWEKKIKPGVLDLANGCNCILGQVYGDYSTGLTVSSIREIEEDCLAPSARFSYGFSAEGDGGTMRKRFALLTKAWLLLLAERAAAPFLAAIKKGGRGA